jgi:hypothetical protein
MIAITISNSINVKPLRTMYSLYRDRLTLLPCGVHKFAEREGRR